MVRDGTRTTIELAESPRIPDLASHSLLIHEILRYCNNSSLTQCLRVNKNLSALAGPILYNQVDIRTDKSDQFIRQFMKGCPLETKRINVERNTKWKPLLLTYVKHLTLRGEHVEALHKPTIILKAPNLDTLRITYGPIRPRVQVWRISYSDACHLLEGLDPKTLVFDSASTDFGSTGHCVHAHKLKKLERLVLAMNDKTYYGHCNWKIFSLPLAGKRSLPAQVDIIFVTPSPKKGNNRPTSAFIIHTGTLSPLADYLASLPWEHKTTRFRLVNTDAVMEKKQKGGNSRLRNRGELSDELQRCMRQYRAPPSVADKEARSAAIEDAKGRMELVTMEDYLSNNRWETIFDEKDIKGWLKHLYS